MNTLLVFGITLLVAIYISGLAHRTILSTTVIFLAVGFLCGDGIAGIIHTQKDTEIVGLFSELALVAVLFTDGMRLDVRTLRTSWRLPLRALMIGMPVTAALTTLLAHFIAGLPWLPALLLGSLLSPTDPVLISSIVGHEAVPRRLRDFLNIESGFNDGMALPAVILLIGLLTRQEVDLFTLLAEVIGGVVLGIAIPWLALQFERRFFFAATGEAELIQPFAIVVILFALCRLTTMNEYLAAFSAGISLTAFKKNPPQGYDSFERTLARVFELAAILLFGALVSPGLLAEVTPQGYLFALLSLLAVRPVAMLIALPGTGLPKKEWAAAAFFGPKGFASVVYALLMLSAGFPEAAQAFSLAAIVIAGSIILNSTLDVPAVRWLSPPPPNNG